ncbi:hypothetical protein ABFS83_01G049700 [Erythranthe nasuta]
MDTLSSSSFHPKLRPPAVGIPTKKPRTTSIVNNSSSNIFRTVNTLISRKFQGKLKKQSLSNLHEIIFKPLNDFVTRLTDMSRLPPYIDPNHSLSGNFSPVDELPPTACKVVVGSLPPCLDGAYIQNGPNPQFTPTGPHHIADGDGMLHSVRISGGKATFCSRFVKTHKYLTESDIGYPIFPNPVAYFNHNSAALMALTLARILSGQLNPFINGVGTANTSLFLFAGNLLALIEYDLPYALKFTEDGDIVTVGRNDFFHSGGGGITNLFLNMTAHPKIDAETGEAFAYRYFLVPPFLTYFRIDPDGQKQADVPIFSVKGLASYMHDFAVTKNFAVFNDTQILLDPLALVRGKNVLKADPDKVSRIGIIPRYAVHEREMCWIDVHGLNMMHAVNAWEEDDGGTIVIVVANILSVVEAVNNMDSMRLSLEKITIDAREKKVVMRRSISDTSLDFGTINPRYAGKKSRYIYAAVMETVPKMVGLVKVDLSLLAAEEYSGDCTVASRMYGQGCYGSEPIFVAREPPDNPAAAEEDDGYLLSYIYNEDTDESHFLVMDAKSPDLETVAAVKLPRRVPHGFHSVFVREIDLPLI